MKMSHRVLCFVSVYIIAVISVIAQNQIDKKCGIQGPDNKVPWIVAIEPQITFSLQSKILITGALISRKHVICPIRNYLFQTFGKLVAVYLEYNITESCSAKCRGQYCEVKPGSKARIESSVMNGSYTQLIDEVLLITLHETVPYSDSIRPICLPSVDAMQSDATEQKFTFAGLVGNQSTKKIQAVISTWNKLECKRLFSNLNQTSRNMTCATSADNDDLYPLYGSILMKKRGEHYELIGLLQHNKCQNYSTMFSNVFLYNDWIKSNINNLTIEGTNITDDALVPLTYSYIPTVPEECGKRKVDLNNLIMTGEATQAGDWPWHVAIYRLYGSNTKYTCGGTLISKIMVLTAAHCGTEKGVPVIPDILSVILGKYNLVGKDLTSQERQVYSVIVHEDFGQKNHLDNDIALLKLETAAIYSDYVQPACIWSSNTYDRFRSENIFGLVVGWGLDQSQALSPQLKQTIMPKVSDITCINKNPSFYNRALGNKKKFCAGWANGTSACNGDSGSGFLVYVPDTSKVDSLYPSGSWYVEGIVSTTISLKNYAQCDPNQYVVFTDVDKYTDWIQKHLYD